MASCRAEPRIAAPPNPAPISTPLTACTPISAAASPVESLPSGHLVPAETIGHAVRHDLDDAAERVAFALAGIDQRRRFLLRGLVPERVVLRSVASCAGRLDVLADLAREIDAADGRRVPEHVHAERLEELLGQGAPGHAGRRLARTRPLDHVAHVREAAVQRPGEVGVARPRRVDGGQVLVGLVAVGDLERDRVAGGAAVPHPGQEGDLVALGLLARAAAAALLAPREAGVHVGLLGGRSGRAAR